MAKKPLRDISPKGAPKGDTKLISDKLKGVNKSETKPMDLDDFLMDPDNMKGSKDFIKKHEVQTHADRVGNKEVPYKSSKGEAKYARADGKMYEAAECSCDDDKDGCPVHGKKGKKLLLGGKKGMNEHSEFSGLDAMPGAAPAGMVRHAENTWKTAENYFDKPPTQLTGEGKPFLSKLGSEIKNIQKEAVENLDEKNWIKGAIKHPGALHKELGVPEGEKIPAAKLNAAAKKGGKEGMRARFAQTLKKMHEDAPPSKNSEEWIKKNKSRFTKEYGKKKGEEVLYGKAWNDYKAKHEETQTDYTNTKNGQTKPQLPNGRNLDTGNL
jgi:hypothetical protein